MGVFGVSEEAELRRLFETRQVTWPCFYWMPSDPPPALEWGVRDWPANFLIDRRGLVRAVNLFDEGELNSMIENLLAEPSDGTIQANSD